MIDFDTLADLAYNRSTLKPSEREDLINLWTEFFKLDEWLFIVDASQSSLEPVPFVGFIEDRPWFFVFTDSQRALEFAKKFSLTDKNNECLYLSLSPESALKILASSQNADGIRINEGPHGWFSPLQNVEQIHSLLQSLDHTVGQRKSD